MILIRISDTYSGKKSLRLWRRYLLRMIIENAHKFVHPPIIWLTKITSSKGIDKNNQFGSVLRIEKRKIKIFAPSAQWDIYQPCNFQSVIIKNRPKFDPLNQYFGLYIRPCTIITNYIFIFPKYYTRLFPLWMTYDPPFEWPYLRPC